MGVPSPAAANAAPAGALPKDGQVPAKIGGTVGGKVTALSDGRPVGRLQVDAFRRSVAGDLVPWYEARRWGGMLNVLVLLFFLANTALAVRAAKKTAPAH